LVCFSTETELLTDKYSLAETAEAFEKAIHDKTNTLKIMIYPGQTS